MIISQTPFRITLGGGGTDLPSYYAKHGGFVVSSAINKYVYITVNHRTVDRKIWLSYSKIESPERAEEIHHELIREVFKDRGIADSIEIHSITELSSGTGLGSSGSFLVGLITAVNAFQNRFESKRDIAELACDIEISRLTKSVGKQDQYIAAFGGIIALEIDRNGVVTVTPLKLSEDIVSELERNSLLFFTGVQRSASDILDVQKKRTEQDDRTVVEALHRIKDIGYRTREALEKGDTRAYGRLMHEHWETKKKLSANITLSNVDGLYIDCLKMGALGGKIIGAGGGGFLMIYAEEKHREIRRFMTAQGLIEMRFRFDWLGTKIIGNFM